MLGQERKNLNQKQPTSKIITVGYGVCIYIQLYNVYLYVKDARVGPGWQGFMKDQ